MAACAEVHSQGPAEHAGGLSDHPGPQAGSRSEPERQTTEMIDRHILCGLLSLLRITFPNEHEAFSFFAGREGRFSRDQLILGLHRLSITAEYTQIIAQAVCNALAAVQRACGLPPEVPAMVNLDHFLTILPWSVDTGAAASAPVGQPEVREACGSVAPEHATAHPSQTVILLDGVSEAAAAAVHEGDVPSGMHVGSSPSQTEAELLRANALIKHLTARLEDLTCQVWSCPGGLKGDAHTGLHDTRVRPANGGTPSLLRHLEAFLWLAGFGCDQRVEAVMDHGGGRCAPDIGQFAYFPLRLESLKMCRH